MTFRPVDTGWASELIVGLREDARELRIVCPFIRARALDPLLALQPELIRVITRFKLADFADGVSDITALHNLLGAGASVRGIRNLHAKLYLLGTSRAIVTSANLTEAGLWRNHEFGMFTDNHAAVAACHAYFDDLWGRAGDDLGLDQLEKWTATVTRHLASGARPGRSARLEDFGADAGIDDPPRPGTPQLFADPPQAFVKFLGDSANRVPACFPTLDEIDRAGCHWALSYPLNKRPRRVEDGAVIFIARLTDEPDIRVFGRAIGMKHQEGRDDATPADIERRPGIERWPHYIRVHHAEFVAGTMANGVSLNELMDTLESDSFAPTQRNAAAGAGNRDPRRAYLRKPDVMLSADGLAWLGARLQAAFEAHGTVPPGVLAALHWPDPDELDTAPQFTRAQFEAALALMLDEARAAGHDACRIVSRDLHRRVVGASAPNRMRMACRAMWSLWETQGSRPENVIHTTPSGESSTIEIEFTL